jgi:hypothetical protein
MTLNVCHDLLGSVFFCFVSNGIALYHHIQQGKASNVLHELSKYMVWGASLTTGNLSAGVMILTTVSARGEMDFKQIHLPPFL